MIREIHSGKGAVCAEILASLPLWFGIPESNAAYKRDVQFLPMFVAEDGGRIQGFIALKRHTPFAYEIHVLGVRPELHRKGLGRALVARGETLVRESGARFLTVKTLSASDPDPGYARTRAFYAAMGFVPIEEFGTLWNPDNPPVMMLKVLDRERSR
jgi:GNAT superfamily N-acetyltransferase